MPASNVVRPRKPLRFNLPGAYIAGTKFNGTNLTRANLSGANCTQVDFSDSIMREANLSGTILVMANLRRVDFKDANFKGADLRGADMTDAINLTAQQISEAIVDSETKLPHLSTSTLD